MDKLGWDHFWKDIQGKCPCAPYIRADLARRHVFLARVMLILGISIAAIFAASFALLVFSIFN